MPDTQPPDRLDALLSPAALGALALLLANDFVLKPAFHNAVTGKLSDFAGLFLFALFWCALFPGRRTLVVAATALGFALWKAPVSQPLLDAWNAVGLFRVARVLDATDLAALLVLPLAHAYRPRPWPGLPARRVLRPAVAIACIFAFAATSRLPNQLPVPGAEYELVHPRLDALQRIYELRLSYDGWGSPPVASVDGPDTVTITLLTTDSVRTGYTDAIRVEVEVAARGSGSTLRLLKAWRYGRLQADSVRSLFERRVVERLRRDDAAMGNERGASLTSGRDRVLRPRILEPTSLARPRAQVAVSLARPAHVALVEVTPMLLWRVIYPVTREQLQLLEAGEHTLTTACAAPGAAPERIPAGEEVPPCGVADPLTVVDMRERNPLPPTRGCPDPRLVFARQQPNAAGALVLLAADAPITPEAMRRFDGRCGLPLLFHSWPELTTPLWREIGARTWAISSIELRR